MLAEWISMFQRGQRLLLLRAVLLEMRKAVVAVLVGDVTVPKDWERDTQRIAPRGPKFAVKNVRQRAMGVIQGRPLTPQAVG